MAAPINFQMMAALTAASDKTSAALFIDRTMYASWQVVTSGTATGTLKIQVSNDIVASGQVPANWTDLSGATVTPAAAGALLIVSTLMTYQWCRAVWTHDNGGTGTITVTVCTVDY